MYECKYCSRVAFILSFGPSVCGWKAVLSRLSIPKFFVLSFHNSKVSRLPLSGMISLGIPCSRTIGWVKSVANCRASIYFRHGMKCVILVRKSMTTSIVSYPSELVKSVMKSIAIDCQGWSGTWFGCRSPYGAWRTALLCWHVSQFLIYRLMVSHILGK